MAKETQNRERDQARSNADLVKNAGVDLNTASRDELTRLPSVDPRLADEILRLRPFRTWTDLDRIPGFQPDDMHRLISEGAVIGTEPG